MSLSWVRPRSVQDTPSATEPTCPKPLDLKFQGCSVGMHAPPYCFRDGPLGGSHDFPRGIFGLLHIKFAFKLNSVDQFSRERPGVGEG